MRPNYIRIENKSNDRQIGIIGGGQLALMLADAGCRLGYSPVIFTLDPNSPAAKVYSQIVIGSIHNLTDLEDFFSKVKIVIFENEFVNCELLRQAAYAKNVEFIPSLKTIERLQDKLQQKFLLKELDIPTANFHILDLRADLIKQIKLIQKEFRDGCVLKWSRMGYDGKGVLILDPESQEDVCSRIESFCSEALRMGSSVYVEEKINFRRELAMISVYSIQREFLSYPLVISEQKKGACYRVYGPASCFGVSPSYENQGKIYASRIAEFIQLYGSFGIEFFESKTGELIVNEIAPRVHNTGHYTQDACLTSQFENHWRASFGMELGKIQTAPAFAMLNLLAPVLVPEGQVLDQDELLPFEKDLTQHFSFQKYYSNETIRLHWYGKKEFKPWRKLGHVNAALSSAERVNPIFAELEKMYVPK